MIGGDCNVCINGKMPSYSATCVECGLSRKNYKPITNADKLRAMSDEELAEIIEQYEPHEAWSFYLDGRTWLDWLRQEAQP